jgi:hypothetical protein
LLKHQIPFLNKFHFHLLKNLMPPSNKFQAFVEKFNATCGDSNR